MKKKILLMSAITIAILTACQNDAVENVLAESEMNSDVNHVTMSVKDFEWDGLTRTTAELTSTGIAFKWAIGDEIGVFPSEGDQVRFPIEEGAGTANATFNGGGWALKSGYTYVAYYPFSEDNYKKNSRKAIPITYKGQTQIGNASLASINKCDYIVSNLSAPEYGEVNFQFSHLSALVRFVLTMPKAGTFNSLTLSTENDVLPVERNLDLSTTTPIVTNKTMSNTISMSLTNVTTTADNQTITLYMLMPACDLSGKTIKATVDDYTINLTGKNMIGGKAYSYTGVMEKVYEVSGFKNGHAYVDLALPSGTLWATCNVGANTPEDYGYYFAWGETTGYTNDNSRNFSWIDYKWCSGSGEKLTKYCTSTFYWDRMYGASPDYERELNIYDDAAFVNWGSNWCIPNTNQIDELIKNTTTMWVTRNGVNGIKFAKKTDSSIYIFFPAAGSYNGNNLFGNGRYWSSSLETTRNEYAYCLDFGPDEVIKNYISRCNGLPIRPVCILSN